MSVTAVKPVFKRKDSTCRTLHSCLKQPKQQLIPKPLFGPEEVDGIEGQPHETNLRSLRLEHVEFQKALIELLKFDQEPKLSAVLTAERAIRQVGIIDHPVVHLIDDGMHVVTKPDVIRAWQKLGNTTLKLSLQGNAGIDGYSPSPPGNCQNRIFDVGVVSDAQPIEGGIRGGTRRRKARRYHKPHEAVIPAQPYTMFVGRAMKQSRRKVELLLKLSKGLTPKSVNFILEMLEEERRMMAEQDDKSFRPSPPMPSGWRIRLRIFVGLRMIWRCTGRTFSWKASGGR